MSQSVHQVSILLTITSASTPARSILRFPNKRDYDRLTSAPNLTRTNGVQSRGCKYANYSVGYWPQTIFFLGVYPAIILWAAIPVMAIIIFAGTEANMTFSKAKKARIKGMVTTRKTP